MSHVLIYHGQVTTQGARNAETLIANAYSEGVEEILLCISSGGGDVNAGLGLFNFIRMMPITIHTHTFGMCGSIAATIFLAGQRRTAASVSAFALHAASFSSGPRAGEVSPNTNLIAQPFIDLAGWDSTAINRFFGTTEESYLSPANAVELGVAHEVLDLTFESGTTVVTIALTD